MPWWQCYNSLSSSWRRNVGSLFSFTIFKGDVVSKSHFSSCRAIRCRCGQLGQWTKVRITIEPLFTTIQAKVRKRGFLDVPFFPLEQHGERVSWMQLRCGELSHCGGASDKGFLGRRVGEELGIEKYWVKVEKMSQLRLSVWRPPNTGAWARNAGMYVSVWACLAVEMVGGWVIPPHPHPHEACQGKPCN